MVLIFLFMYAPIFLLMAFSFNSTKSRSVWTGLFPCCWQPGSRSGTRSMIDAEKGHASGGGLFGSDLRRSAELPPHWGSSGYDKGTEKAGYGHEQYT